MDASTVFQKYQKEILGELTEALKGHQLPLYDMLRYHLGWTDDKGVSATTGGGKGLRPALCLAACRGVGGDYRQALPAAAALELVHNFSLIHDDIQDESHQRRHRPTVWSIWGMAQGINAGDSMYALAHLSLLRLREKGVPDRKILEATRILGETCLRLCEGQYMDLAFENRLDIGVETYLEMISRKTAALIETSLHLGALLGCEDAEKVEPFRRCGFKLGLAFQIRDDILGIWGEEDEMGKSSASDLQKRKKTLPVIYAFANAQGEIKGRLMDIYRKPELTPQDVTFVIDVLGSLGAEDYAQKTAGKYTQEGLSELSHLNLPPSNLEELVAMIPFMTERGY